MTLERAIREIVCLDKILAKRSDSTVAEDRAIETVGGSPLMMPRCTTCGRVLLDSTWRESLQMWICPGYAGDGMTYEEAAALRLGPFAPKHETYQRKPIPGFVQTGPTSYERIVEPDPRGVFREGLRAVRKLRERGEW